jgi:bis(5'-nucleosyl)-tetraphosphatase (symmetrical)
MANYVVGDIQGCFQPLRRLLDKIAFNPSRDVLWSVGDMVNRGPQSLEALRFLSKLDAAFIGVLGNHDLHFLAMSSGANPEGKLKFLKALLDAPDCLQLAEWVRQRPLAHSQTLQTDKGLKRILMVHAGIVPNWNTATAAGLAREVERELRGPRYTGFLRGMYGDRPDRWHEDLQGIERLRTITNVLTRLRFCTADGQMNLHVKTEAATAPPGYRPWFEYQTLAPDELLLFGHWATLDGATHRQDIQGLDTGCVWGRSLTLLHIEKNERISVTCKDM